MLILLQQAPYTCRRKPPFRDASIGRQSPLEWRRREAVLIDRISANNRSKSLDVQVGVLDFQRIEGPLHQLEAVSDRVVTLCQFETPSKSQVAIVLANGQH